VKEVGMRSTPWIKLSLGSCLVLGVLGGVSALPSRQGAGQDEKLARILERTKEYSLKLEKAALDFICVEKIEEKIFSAPWVQPDLDVSSGSPGMTGDITHVYSSPSRSYSNTCVYDYQFVRKGGQKTERRILTEENGRKKNEEDAEISTQTIRVENALFGPIGLLGPQGQAGHDYKIVGEETQDGKKIVVIEASPKPSLNRPHCFGRIWVQESDSSVVKISWEQASVGNFSMIEATAQALKAEPRLTSVTEYGLVKNGIRFPSKDTTEEAYLLKDGTKYIKSKTTILYGKYKFFTVETEIKY
jgi:hypothetical protein